MQKGIHLSVFGSEFLFDRRVGVVEQRVVLGVLRDEVGSNALRAFENLFLLVFAPGVAEEAPNLLA